MNYLRGNFFRFFTFVTLAVFALPAASQTRAPLFRIITIITEPAATIWIDGVRYGVTDGDGKLSVKTSGTGRRIIRARADGFAETSKPLLVNAKGDISIPLVKTTDEAELRFQEAERLAVTDREKAAEAYKKSIALKPDYINSHIGLARILSESGDVEGALKAVIRLRIISPANAEASVIEGRIHKDLDDEKKAVAAFKRAVTQGKGFQPEAYAGLGLFYKEKAESLGGEPDPAKENAAYAEAAKNLAIAVKQLSGAPDAIVIYQLLGLIYERQNKFNEAITVYQEYLKIFPDSSEAEAVRSYIVQIKKQMADQE